LGAQEPGGWSCLSLPRYQEHPKSLPYPQPATSPASHTQPQPKHLSHRARSSVEIMITVITNNNNNNKVIKTKGRGGLEKTLKHSDKVAPNTKHCKTMTTCTCNNTRIKIIATTTTDLGTQENCPAPGPLLQHKP